MWGTGPSLAWFRRSDHFGPPDQPLSEYVRSRVQEEGHCRPEKVFLLTNLRYFGFVFNPVSFYFCLNAEDHLETLVAEVTNTPWNETHTYVIPADQIQSPTQADRPVVVPKSFHVSPFMPMEQSYQWRVGLQKERLELEILSRPLGKCENREVGARIADSDTIAVGNPACADEGGAAISVGPDVPPCFRAGLQLEAREMSVGNRWFYLLMYPLLTVRIVMLIYWQALKLWWKGVAYVPHPETSSQQGTEAVTANSFET